MSAVDHDAPEGFFCTAVAAVHALEDHARWTMDDAVERGHVTREEADEAIAGASDLAMASVEAFDLALLGAVQTARVQREDEAAAGAT